MKKVIGGVVGVLVLLVGAFFGLSDDGGLKVASFNGEVFGDAKISNVGVDYFVEMVSGYDVFFLLEIRDADGSSFRELCLALDGYSCFLSDRSGRTQMKEAVGVFYRDDLEFFNRGDDSFPLGDSDGVFERLPVVVEVEGTEFWVVHLDPDNVYREMEALEGLVGEFGGDVVIGDLNADCDYYSGGVDFRDWVWVIGDEVDTTSGFSDCAYDRVIVSSDVDVVDGGVVEVDGRVSDHHLVFVEIG